MLGEERTGIWVYVLFARKQNSISKGNYHLIYIEDTLSRI